MSFQLAFEPISRKACDLKPIANLWGQSSSCIWARPEDAEASARVVMQSPEKACRALGLSGASRMALVDELFVHRQMVAAHAVASYLATEVLCTTLGGKADRGGVALSKVVLLRQKAAQILIESGRSYERARSELIEIDSLAKALPKTRPNALLIANTSLLRARLLQLLSLRDRAGEQLTVAERLLHAEGYGLPEGWELLRTRTTLAGDGAAKQRETRDSEPFSHRRYADNLYGGQAESYRLYLVARDALEEKRWQSAVNAFDASKEALRNRGHCRLSDPIRSGYLVLGRGQAQAELGFEADRLPEIEMGLKSLLKARWEFREIGFTPGEFVAYREFILMNERLEQLTRRRTFVSSAKEMFRIGKATGVAVWHLEAGVRRAHELLADGRPNAANAAITELMDAINGDPLVAEVKKAPAWGRLEKLLGETADAADNGVDPLARWGLSDYASNRELTFVTDACAEPRRIVSAAPEGARGIYFMRVMEARGHHANLWVEEPPLVAGVVAGTLEAKFASGLAVRLSDLNRWAKADQHEVLALLLEHPEWHERAYVALSRPLLDPEMMNELTSNWHTVLSPASLEIDPLSTRPQDTLLLARGFLVRRLLKRGEREAKRLILTGRACAFIRHRYREIGELSRGMETLANRLDFKRDTIEMSDGRRRVPAEVLEQFLPNRAANDPAQLPPRPRRRGR